MEIPPSDTVTRLLLRWRQGDQQALDQLFPLIYADLHSRAARYMASERRNHTLQPTALINECCLRLIDANVSFKDRAHFLALAAKTMRRILIEHARTRLRKKRGGGVRHSPLDEAGAIPVEEDSSDILALNEAMEQLAVRFPEEAEMVELAYFGGLTAKEIEGVLEVPWKKVNAHLKFAKVWLNRRLAGSKEPRRG